MRLLISLARVHKIPRATREEFNKMGKGEQQAYLKEYPNSSFKHNTASVKNIALDVKTEANALGKHLKLSGHEIASALRHHDIQKALSYGAKATIDALESTLSFVNTTARSTFEELAKTKAIKKLQSGSVKADAFLKKHPVLRKMGGPLIAGALVYQWMNMSFSGDFDDDFDVSAIGQALSGEYSIHDLVASPSGMKALAQLALGVASGGMLSFPWSAKFNIMFAAAYTGAKKVKNSKLAAKLASKGKAAMGGKHAAATG